MLANCPECGEEVKMNDIPTVAGTNFMTVAAGKGSQGSDYRVPGTPVTCPNGHSFKPINLRLERAK
jgi:hypothetical protein